MQVVLQDMQAKSITCRLFASHVDHVTTFTSEYACQVYHMQEICVICKKSVSYVRNFYHMHTVIQDAWQNMQDNGIICRLG